MLDLEITPERSLGCEQWEFVLGMHFSQAVAIIQTQVGIIKGVQVLYNDNDPLEVDLIINLPQDGIRLYFDPIGQRLKVIEINNMKLVKLKYCHNIVNSPEIVPTLEHIEHSFGCTHPGEYDAENQLFVLNFRGLTLYFPVDANYQKGSAHNIGSLRLTTGSGPILSQVSIYNGPTVEQATSPELPLLCYYGQIYLKRADVVRGENHTKGLKLTLMMCGSARRVENVKVQLERYVLLGQSAQDVTSTLGAPSKVFFKSEDKMRIHSPSAHRRIVQKSDYFFNYFTLGMDILFDAKCHIAKKIVMHTNYPGHYNFNMYQRCEFHLQLDNVEVTAYSRWDDIKKELTPSERPVVLNRSSSSSNTTNPFGSTFCYGFQDIIFEVMPNNYIASISIYGDGHSVDGEKESA